MVVKRMTDGGERLDKPELSEEMKVSGDSKVWYRFPGPGEVRGYSPLKIHNKSDQYASKVLLKKGALIEINGIIEENDKICETEVFRIFREKAEAFGERTSDSSIERMIRGMLKSGGWVALRETPEGLKPDYSITNRVAEKIKTMLEFRGIEEERFLTELQEKFDIKEERAHDIAKKYPGEKRKALMTLSNLMPQASFDGLDLLLKSSNPLDVEKIDKIVERPADLKNFLETAQLSLLTYLSTKMPGVSDQTLKDFVSKTTLNELAEKIETIKGNKDLAVQFNDEDLARFDIEERKRIALHQTKEKADAFRLLTEFIPDMPPQAVEEIVKRTNPARIAKNVGIVKELGISFSEIGRAEKLEQESHDFRDYCKELVAKRDLVGIIHAELPDVSNEEIAKALEGVSSSRIRNHIATLKELGISMTDIGLDGLCTNRREFEKICGEGINKGLIEDAERELSNVPHSRMVRFFNENSLSIIHQIPSRIENLKNLGVNVKELTDLDILKLRKDQMIKCIEVKETLEINLKNEKLFNELVEKFPPSHKEAFQEIGKIMKEKGAMKLEEMKTVYINSIKGNVEVLKEIRKDRINDIFRVMESQQQVQLSQHEISVLKEKATKKALEEDISDEMVMQMKKYINMLADKGAFETHLERSVLLTQPPKIVEKGKEGNFACFGDREEFYNIASKMGDGSRAFRHIGEAIDNTVKHRITEDEAEDIYKRWAPPNVLSRFEKYWRRMMQIGGLKFVEEDKSSEE